MKLRKFSICLTLALMPLTVLLSGCGSSGATTTTVSVSSSVGDTLILGQSTTLTAIVTGPSNLDVTWGNPNNTSSQAACMYTTTTVNTTTGTSTTSNAAVCPSSGVLGVLSNEQTTGTATFTAPASLPDPTTYPGLQVLITACTVATPIKCNKPPLSLFIDSGITVTLTPNTAAVPISEQQPFFAVLTNDLKNAGVTWLLTQQTPTTTTTSTNTNAYAALTTCTVSGNATGCGSITSSGLYTGPAAVPTSTTPAYTSSAPTNCTTPYDVTVVATSVTDPTRYAIGTITITQGGPITFNGISPTIAPQGAFYWDIYLNAPNMSSSSLITLTDSSNGKTLLNSESGQVKVLFPIPFDQTTTTTGSGTCAVTTTTSAGSSGARIRLFAGNLANTGSVTVSVSDPGEPVTTNPGGSFTYTIMPVRPTVTGTSPNDIIQNTSTSTNTNVPMTLDGGYFGNNGQFANVLFNGNTLPGTTNAEGTPISTAKQLDVQFPIGQINTGLPGLYSLSASRITTPVPAVNNPAVANLAVFPGYALNPPAVTGYVSTGAGTNPSAIDEDPTLGVIAVVETSANAVQFYSVGTGTLTPIGGPVVVGTTPNPVPTGLSVNRTNHTVAVVNYQEQSVTVLPIPGAPTQAPGTPFTFSISGVLQGAVSPAPLPYAIGVDPDTNKGIVAYSSTSTSSASNLGFLIDLNPGDAGVTCFAFSGGPSTPPCAFAQATLNTGPYPQVAMAPHGHLAFVSPGGSGSLSGVDVTKPSNVVGIASLQLAAGIVTVQTTLCNTTSINPSELLFPGNSGTVLITGVPTTNAAGNTNFNGVFTVAAISDTSFTYVVPNSTIATGTVTIPNTTPCSTVNGSAAPSTANVYFGPPNLLYGGISSTAQGIAINPISNTAALADADATGASGPELNIVNNLDQSVSDIGFFSGCTFYSTTCANGPELLGTADVAWQPYSNAIVSYNPGINQVSVSDPTSGRRYAIVCELDTATNGKTGAGTACITNPSSSPLPPVCNGSNTACAQLFLNQTTLLGTGEATINVNNGTTGKLTLWGGLAVDAATNQAFVVMSGNNQIDIINLGPCTPTANYDAVPSSTGCPNPFNNLKPVQVTEILVPSPNPGPGIIGGIPNASVPQGTLTSNSNLVGVQIFGSGFDSTSEVRLDGSVIPASDVTLVSGRELLATIPASFLSFPHRYALDVVTPDQGAYPTNQSNPTDFFVVQAVDLSQICPPTVAQPSSVAIADQLANGPFGPIAVVTNSGCNNVAVIDTNPADVVGGSGPSPGKFGTITNTISVGSGPQGIAISQPFGLAVVANNAAGTASVVNLLTNAEAVPDVSTGTNPSGVAINDATGAAIIANTGSNTVSEIDLAQLFGTSPVAALTPISIGGLQEPTAIAIDPDRGTNNQGIAVVTSLELESGLPPSGALQVVDIGESSPALSTTLSTGTVTAPTTGIVFDPTVITGTTNNGVFYASSAGGNVISSFNPDSGSATTANVGINPTALAINPQTGAILTTNLAGQSASIVDTISSPMKTVQSIGLPGSGQFGVAIDQFTNLAFIVDQANNRLFIMQVPK
jgi:hypothetical protein